MPGGGTLDRPVDPELGDLFFDTDLDALLYWDGSSWVQVVTETPGAGGDYVVLDDGGTQQSIVGGGGLDVTGHHQHVWRQRGVNRATSHLWVSGLATPSSGYDHVAF